MKRCDFEKSGKVKVGGDWGGGGQSRCFSCEVGALPGWLGGRTPKGHGQLLDRETRPAQAETAESDVRRCA